MGLVRVEKKCRVVCDHCGDALDFQVLYVFVHFFGEELFKNTHWQFWIHL